MFVQRNPFSQSSLNLPFPLSAALAGIPVGLFLGWAVVRLWGNSPARHSRSTERFPALAYRGHGFSRADRGALIACAAATASAVLLGATQPESGGWAGWSQTLLLYALVVTLGAVDWRALVVDIRIVALGISLRLLCLALWAPGELWAMGAGLLIGTGFFHLLGLFYEVLRGRQGLGEGDAAVAGLLGCFVGWQGLLPLVGIAAALGLLVSVPWLLLTRRTAAEPVPFVPFLGAAGMIVYLGQLHGWPLPWAWHGLTWP